jgi:UDP-N-acetylmuramate dehydrogenase
MKPMCWKPPSLPARAGCRCSCSEAEAISSIADAGFAGLVLKVGITDLAQSTASHGQVTFIAGAGYDWDTLVAQTVEAGCAGLECLSGIPGTVGGTPVQNVGAYGQEVSGTIQEVRVL